MINFYKRSAGIFLANWFRRIMQVFESVFKNNLDLDVFPYKLFWNHFLSKQIGSKLCIQGRHEKWIDKLINIVISKKSQELRYLKQEECSLIPKLCAWLGIVDINVSLLSYLILI